MDTRNGTTLTLQQEISLFPKKQEIRKKIQKKILVKHGIPKLTEVPTKVQWKWQQILLDQPFTSKMYSDMKKDNLTTKMIINIAFGGSLGTYNEFMRLLKESNSKAIQKSLIKKGKHPIFIEEEEVDSFYQKSIVKEAHAEDYAPILSTHKNRGGTKETLHVRSQFALIYSDFKSENKIPSIFSINGLQAELEPEYGLIRRPTLKKLVKEMNQEMFEFESMLHNQGFGEGNLDRKAMEPITKFCMENASGDYELSNKLGNDARKILNTIGPELAKSIGKKVVQSEELKNDSDGIKEAVAGLVMTTLKTGSKLYQRPMEEMIPYMINVLSKLNKK